MITDKMAYDLGYEDGKDAAIESGTDKIPDCGWVGWLINSIGFTGVCKLFEADPEENRDGWSAMMYTLLHTYHLGACAGAFDVCEANWEQEEKEVNG